MTWGRHSPGSPLKAWWSIGKARELCAGPGALWKRVPVGAAVSVTKALPGPAPQPLPSLLPLPSLVPSPFSPRLPREWTKGGASGAQRAPEALEVQDCGAEEVLGVSVGASVLLFCRPGGHGAEVPGRAKLLLRFAEGAGALPPPIKLFPGERGGVSAAQAQRFPRPAAERLRGFVAGKSAWEQRSVWPIANRCPSPDTHVVLPPQPTPAPSLYLGASLPRETVGGALVRGTSDLTTLREGMLVSGQGECPSSQFPITNEDLEPSSEPGMND